MAELASRPGEDGNHATFCRLCESFCGMIATVKDGKIVAIAPDRDNPHSRGHVCVKGVSMAQVTHDIDRVTTPLKRVGGPGAFEPVSWDEALDDIAHRMLDIRKQHGTGALAHYLGNPTAFSTNAYPAFTEFMAALGSYKLYGAGSQDSNARMTANYMIHGNPGATVLPDLLHCDYLLILGANPLVSNGWMIFNPRWRHDLDEIAARGKVVVVDPRRTETARRYTHMTINPDSDIWLLLGMIRIVLEEGLVDRARIEADTVGLAELEACVMQIPLADVVTQTGMALDALRTMTRDFAASKHAAIYGGLGLCRGRFGTVGGYLSSVLNAVTGRYGQHGGMRFGRQIFAAAQRPPVGGYNVVRTRIGDVPTISGKMGFALFPDDVEQEGEDRVRAFVMSAGNPVLSAPGGDRLKAALGKLNLFVSLDFYQNETNKHAHYILPTTTFLERQDFPFVGFYVLLRPFMQFTDAVIPPVGEARDDYAIYTGIAKRMGLGAPTPSKRKQEQGRYGLLPDPIGQVDRAIRRGPVGDKFGVDRDGWSLQKLKEYPHGVMVEAMPDDRGDWRERIAYPDGKLRIWHELAETEIARMKATDRAAAGTLRLIGRRDIRSINSWMHNVDKLVRSQEQDLLIHPDDARERGISEGDLVRVSNENGAIEVPASVTDEVIRGTVSYPHGWGHAAGWERANRTDGINVNSLLGLGVDSVEFISGMTLIDCLDVVIDRIDPAAHRSLIS
jgi:anaerobic selenocysteine-containing dehydrogenase